MKALVTGGNGFVGSHLIEQLCRRGDEVTALVRSSAKAAFVQDIGATPFRGDLSDAASLQAAVDGREVIFHVAGRVKARDPGEFLTVHRDGTRHLVEAAARHRGQPRFVLVSSLAAAGPSEPGRPRRADEPPQPVTAYGRSKLAAEHVVRESGLPWTIVRPPLVYGPRDTEVFALFRMARSGWAPVFGRGAQELSAIYGPDLAEALIAAATSESAIGNTYCACHPRTVTTADLARMVGRAVGRDVRVVPVPEPVSRVALSIAGAATRLLGRVSILGGDKVEELFQPAWTGDPGPLTRDSGWHARHDLESGLAETARWYREQDWL